ncbi:MAG: CBS domain-containing protein [Rhodocyclaceae bacterium]
MSKLEKETPIRQPLPTVKAPPGTGFCEPETYSMVRGDSPALSVMTDFKKVSVATIGPDVPLNVATQTMISRGVRLLLVINRDDEVLGVITARDTTGERPIQMVQKLGGKFNDLLVRDLMCPREDIDLITIDEVLRAKVVDIVTTLQSLKRQHALVGERDPITGRMRIRGVFSATQIGRQLGAPIQTFDVASTFNEIESYLAREST